MFKTTAILTAAAIAIGSTASATPQLAASLDVQPGVYSTAELIRLRDAMEENNKAVVNFILDRAGETTRAVPSSDVLDMDGDTLSLAEAIRLRAAQENNDTAVVNFILSGEVNDADESFVEDARLRRAMEDNNQRECSSS